MISHKHKCIFIHIPKTAGTSIESALGGWGLTQDNEHKLLGDVYQSQHHTLQSIEKTLRQKYFKFTFVRNPWDRFVSLYFYYKGGGNQKSDIHLKKYIPLDFKSFVTQPLDTIIPRSHLESQFSYLEESGKIELDFIGRFERLEDDYKYIRTKFGLDQKLSITRKSIHKHYTEYYDDETRQIVADKYAKDIEYFRYKFGE